MRQGGGDRETHTTANADICPEQKKAQSNSELHPDAFLKNKSLRCKLQQAAAYVREPTGQTSLIASGKKQWMPDNTLRRA